MADETTETRPETAPEPVYDGGRIARVRKAATRLIGTTAIGGGGGTLGGFITLLGDKSGESMLQSIKWGVFLGGLGGLFKVVHDGPWTWYREFKVDEFRTAALEAERRAADAERKVADCEARYDLLERRFDKIEADYVSMSARLDHMRADYDTSIARAEERYGRLWDRYERDANKVLGADRPGRDNP